MPLSAALESALTRPTEDLVRALVGLINAQGIEINGRLPPIRQLADQLGVKPTAVRDALLRLEALGIVQILPRTGAFLSAPAIVPSGCERLDDLEASVTDGNLLHLLDARRLVEVELVGRAAQRRQIQDLFPIRQALEAMLQTPQEAPPQRYADHDIRFHVEIARLAGNPALFAFEETLMRRIRSYVIEYWSPDGRSAADRTHSAIYEALVAGDADRARQAMNGHLTAAFDHLINRLRKSPMDTNGDDPSLDDAVLTTHPARTEVRHGSV